MRTMQLQTKRKPQDSQNLGHFTCQGIEDADTNQSSSIYNIRV